MLLDRELMYSAGQVLPTGATNSADTVGFPAARNLGSGERLFPYLVVKAKSGSGLTLRAVLVGADDAAFTANKITIFDTGTQNDPPLGFVRMALPSHPPKLYTRIEYTVGGTTPSFTVDAGLALGEQTAGV